MGQQLIWVTNGPKAGQFLQVDDADADDAEAEGWGQKTARRDGTAMRRAVKGRHEAAEAYLDRRAGYTNRKLEAGPPPPPAEADHEEVKKPHAGGRRRSNTAEPS